MWFRLSILVSLAFGSWAGLAYGGVVRYDLPELLGEYRYDGSDPFPFGSGASM